MARFAVGVPLVLLLASVVSAQNPPQSDPQALNLVAQSFTALTGGTVITDATRAIRLVDHRMRAPGVH